ncbi:cartilage intermediate layer protein 1-like [Glandiceps talaboti]
MTSPQHSTTPTPKPSGSISTSDVSRDSMTSPQHSTTPTPKPSGSISTSDVSRDSMTSPQHSTTPTPKPSGSISTSDVSRDSMTSPQHSTTPTPKPSGSISTSDVSRDSMTSPQHSTTPTPKPSGSISTSDVSRDSMTSPQHSTTPTPKPSGSISTSDVSRDSMTSPQHSTTPTPKPSGSISTSDVSRDSMTSPQHSTTPTPKPSGSISTSDVSRDSMTSPQHSTTPTPKPSGSISTSDVSRDSMTSSQLSTTPAPTTPGSSSTNLHTSDDDTLSSTSTKPISDTVSTATGHDATSTSTPTESPTTDFVSETLTTYITDVSDVIQSTISSFISTISTVWTTQPPTTEPTPPPYIRGSTSWLTWGQWALCDVTCGGGMQARSRTCYSENGVDTCIGKSRQNRTCGEWKCPDCNKTCTIGVLDRNCSSCVCEDDTVYGNVTDVSRRPLEGVMVYRAEDPLTAVATTGIHGFYDVTGVCANGTDLIFQKNQFITKTITTSSTSLMVILERSEPLLITEHPQAKTRLVGSDVTMCCMAKGKPQPQYYEWFKDDIILDETIYNYNNTLTIQGLTLNDTGTYTCRANSEAGSQYSMPALLRIIETIETVCSRSPVSKLLKLPEGCQGENGSQYYDVQKCNGNKCPVNNSGDCIDSHSYCCGQTTTELHAISCQAFTLPISVVASCGCTPCGTKTIKVHGRAVAADDGSPLKDGKVSVENEEVDRTNSKGDFSFEIPNGKTRLSVTFRDDQNGELIDTTKVFTLSEDTIIYHKVFLQRRAPTITIDSTVESTIPLGGDPDQSNAELDIPAGSFYKEDGTPFTGNVKASLTQTNLTDPSALDTIQSDLSTRDIEGNQEPLRTYGMFSMQFTDEDNNPLRVDGDMKLYIDAEKLNIDTTADSLPRLWFLNKQTGEWEDIGGLEVSQDRRRKRQLETGTFIVGNINVVGYDLTSLPPCNIDFIEARIRRCYVKVRVYEDDSLNDPLMGAEITAVTNDIIDRNRWDNRLDDGQLSFFYTATTGSDGSVCIKTLCDESLYSLKVRVEHNGKLMTAVHPNMTNKHPGQWPPDLLDSLILPDGVNDTSGWISMGTMTPQQQLDDDNDFSWYSDRFDYKDYFNSESVNVDPGPFYWQWEWQREYRQRCEAATPADNHLIFFKKETKVLYSNDVESYDIDNENHYKRDRIAESWYPYETGDKRACFIKIRVASSNNERISVISHAGDHPRVQGVTYGFRINEALDSTVPEQSNYKVACVEFKCSGYLREGDHEGEEYILNPNGGDADLTRLEIYPHSPSWSRCTVAPDPSLGTNKPDINSELFEYIDVADLEDELRHGDQLRKVYLQVPYDYITPYTKGIYISNGAGRRGYDAALENCYAGYGKARPGTIRENSPKVPNDNWAFTYVCT